MSETRELVRVAVELFMPGARIHSPRIVKWYKNWNYLHSRRILFPVLPIDELMSTDEHGSVTVLQDFMHIKLTAIGLLFIHPLVDGVIDNMMSSKRLDELLGDDLALIAQKAMLYAPPYFHDRTTTSWISVMRAAEEESRLSYMARVNFNDIVGL